MAIRAGYPHSQVSQPILAYFACGSVGRGCVEQCLLAPGCTCVSLAWAHRSRRECQGKSLILITVFFGEVMHEDIRSSKGDGLDPRKERKGLDALMTEAYVELREIAKSYLLHEKVCYTMQPTDLVNEASRRLV